MDLNETRVREECASLMRSPGRSDITALRVGREVKNIAVAAGSKNHRICSVGTDLARYEITNHDSFGMSVDQYQVEHFSPGMHFHRRCRNLMF
jgi:hypothetical protein